MVNGPIVFDEDPQQAIDPAEAPSIETLSDSAAMTQVIELAGRGPSRLARWFWGVMATLLGFLISLAAWDYATALLARSPVLGGAATVLFAILCAILLIIALRELAAFGRLARIDGLRQRAGEARASDNLEEARRAAKGLIRLYRGRPETQWGRDRLSARLSEVMDASGLLEAAETDLLAPLDRAAFREVEAASRQVATVTAIVPLALADVFTALTANVRMIRRVAEVYGGRSGTLGSWRLTRTVITHLVATGAVAVGDDLIGSIAGGGVLSRVSRRFGEGVINGALTARVGVAAIEVCRPLPFAAEPAPAVTGILKRALTGLFGSAKD